MKMLLLSAIRLYWRYWPEAWRRRCLYRESCSRRVHRVARTQGFAAGLHALMRRLRTCRPGYEVYAKDSRLRVRLADGSSIDERDAAPHVLAPYRCAAERLRPSSEERETRPFERAGGAPRHGSRCTDEPRPQR